MTRDKRRFHLQFPGILFILLYKTRTLHKTTLQEALYFHQTDHFYRPQTKSRKGNVFTSVCQEFCPQWGRCTPRQTPPPGQTPPSPGRRLLQRTVRILLECIFVLSKKTMLKEDRPIRHYLSYGATDQQFLNLQWHM